MKVYIKIVFLLGFVMSSYGQITFNGCHPLFEDQDYIFNQVSTDATGRNIFSTIPIDGIQTCGGIGTCEFMMSWNDTSNQWEFVADDGDGDFLTPFLVFFNTSPSSPNPPSLNLGTWVENTVITNGDCGGNLSPSNAIITGDVQDEITLGISELDFKKQISVYPKPVNTTINIHTNLHLKQIKVYDLNGKMILTRNKNFKKINVSNLKRGFYLLEINYNGFTITEKIIIN